mgnify:CR=1 FL=1
MGTISYSKQKVNVPFVVLIFQSEARDSVGGRRMRNGTSIIRNLGRVVSFFLAVKAAKIFLKLLTWNPFARAIGLQNEPGGSHFIFNAVVGLLGIVAFEVAWNKFTFKPKAKE